MSTHEQYYVPAQSKWPIIATLGMLLSVYGLGTWFNDLKADRAESNGPLIFFIGGLFLAYMLFGWFGTVSAESEHGSYNRNVDVSFRWGMSWFIFSEVMFFGAFFTALWWMRAHSVPALGGLENSLLWPDFKAAWPSSAPGVTASPGGIVEPFQTMTPFWLPTINTALLLTSGVTLTIAHHALQAGNRAKTITWMWATVALGVVFLFVQGYEYVHAYRDLNLKLTSGAYGSTFFMLTGFHGFHVFVGMLMLLFITLRLQKGHFSAERHFGFEGAAWYWHFVDVVWLGLYILVYWM